MEAVYTMNVTANASLYAWPNPDNFKDCDWIKIRYESTDEYRELTEESPRVLADADYYAETDTDRPFAWARAGNAFRIRPIPDASTYGLRLKAWEYPGYLVADGNTNWFTVNRPKLVILGTTMLAALYWGEPSEAAVWQALYRDELGKATSVDKRVQERADLTLLPSLVAGKPVSARPGGAGRPVSWRIRGAYS